MRCRCRFISARSLWSHAGRSHGFHHARSTRKGTKSKIRKKKEERRENKEGVKNKRKKKKYERRNKENKDEA